jgi:hypothetical protein
VLFFARDVLPSVTFTTLSRIARIAYVGHTTPKLAAHRIEEYL